ncbi:unnamed protein product [[Actinomadura] parvosata subsp. kistnae]|uniref:DUF4352 domain-containing protein n=1 Tax=[Actinomadura] parvosata subsp. kistnae TaxID=1909395 RepID=A0A1U9ZSC8_9ACTN|nr:DUF4352 domain-containing protein [Nonomuraea sp. ATCC 55076]AQZ60839.1 hypothetical protein BKM31_04440 [Nonomuraea sp. ATCC 55076]SPL90504.1 unnamed protein product [Actinomadura parvosata subsp. kistnae]
MGYPSEPHRPPPYGSGPQQHESGPQPYGSGPQPYGPGPQPYGSGPQYTAGPGHPGGPPYGYGPPAPPAPRRNLALVLSLSIGLPLLLLGGFATAWFVLAAPARDTVTSASDSPAEALPSSQEESEPAAQASEEEPASQEEDHGGGLTSKVGGTVTLTGLEAGSKMAVTLDQVYADAEPTLDSLQPKPGYRLCAVKLTLANKGSVVYKDAPMNGAVLIDADSQEYQFSISRVEQGQQFHWATSINPGDSRKGLVVFEVPQAAKMVKFQFSLNSGYARQRGEWTLS